MPQNTGAAYATTAVNVAGTLTAAWTNPGNAAQAGEPSDTASTAALSLTTLNADTLQLGGYKLLAEDGGTIPAGATIVAVTAQLRRRVANSTGGLDSAAGQHTCNITVGGATRASYAALAPAAKTDSGFVTSQVATGGTIAAPQTTYSRADLAAGSIRHDCSGTMGGLLGSSTLYTAWAALIVDWVLFADGAGGTKSRIVAAGTATSLVTVTGGGKASAPAGGQPHTLVNRGAAGSTSRAVAGGQPHTLVSTAGGTRSTSTTAAAAHVLVTPAGGSKASASGRPAGPATVVSYSIAGYARDPTTDLGVNGVRVDVYKVSGTGADAHQGRTLTANDAGGQPGYYAVAIPHTGNETATFWARFRQASVPVRLDTTDEDLALFPSIVQTA